MKDNALPPNFDDERTLQTARRVVPLNQIEAKVRRRRHWFLGGAFVVAMMLGAASALVASYVRLRTAPAPVADNEAAPGDVPAPVAVAANPLPTDSPASEEAPKKEPVAKRRAVAKRAEEPSDLPDDPHITEAERLQQIRDAVLYDKWQEQRARRVYRRDRRLDRYNHRDLSNLDEIFEGRKRP
jgi:hypothetical protein